MNSEDTAASQTGSLNLDAIRARFAAIDSALYAHHDIPALLDEVERLRDANIELHEQVANAERQIQAAMEMAAERRQETRQTLRYMTGSDADAR